MLNLIRKCSPHLHSRTSPLNNLLRHSFSPSPISNPSNQTSFSDSYLVNTYGFSPKDAKSASENLNFFKRHGFTQNQVTDLVEKFPDVLRHSVKNDLIPGFEFLRELLQSYDHAVDSVARFPPVLMGEYQDCLKQNVKVLRELGVREQNIKYLVRTNVRCFVVSGDKFRGVVEEVKGMGLDPAKKSFAGAVYVLLVIGKSEWENKVELYKKLGLSADEVMTAFGKHPYCMMLSEDHIVRKMDFFVQKMGWQPAVLADRSCLMTLSLDERIVPRCLLYQDILDKGLIEHNNFSFVQWLCSSEAKFLNKIKAQYEKDAQELLTLYQEKLNIAKQLDEKA